MCSVESRSIYPVAGQDMLSKAILGKKKQQVFSSFSVAFDYWNTTLQGLKKEFQTAEDHAQKAECFDTNV